MKRGSSMYVSSLAHQIEERGYYCKHLKFGTGKSGSHPNSANRSVHVVRPISPRSPSASAFDSVEGSDDEDVLTENDTLDPAYLKNNETNGVSENNDNAEQLSLPAPSMIRSHSISGDLHGVPPDPVAADILRKEPEQETFVRLKITPSETPSSDEADSYKVIQECLELRDQYIFREKVAPWEKEVISEPGTPKPNPNPFHYSSEGKSDHFFQMEDGVVQVYANRDARDRGAKLFPVADATTFFTDFHHIIGVAAAGNIRTLCHHRLVLLEQVATFPFLTSELFVSQVLNKLDLCWFDTSFRNSTYI